MGYTINTMGQLVTESGFLSGGCFSPARKLMTCCVADMFTVGFTCQTDTPLRFEDGEWVQISGILTLVNMEEYQELRILVDEMQESSKPKIPYAYSY